jgi:hypothetical protein
MSHSARVSAGHSPSRLSCAAPSTGSSPVRTQSATISAIAGVKPSCSSEALPEARTRSANG